MLKCLENNIESAIVLHKYNTNKPIDENDRVKIARTIINHLFLNNYDQM